MTDILTAAAGLPERTFEPGEALIREGGASQGIYILIEGEVTVLKGTVEVARTKKAGAFFGEMSALLKTPNSATVAARTPVRAYYAEDGPGYLAAEPGAALHCARLLAQRLYDSTTYLADCKVQFEDRKDHFAMVDQILESLMQQQRTETTTEAEAPADPRL